MTVHASWLSFLSSMIKLHKYVLALVSVLIVVAATCSPSVEAKSTPFKDVPSSHWAYSTIMWSKDNGISSGYPDGTFQPSKLVTESEFISMLLRCYPELIPAAGMTSKPWHKSYYDLANELNWPVYNEPDWHMERGHTAELIAAALGNINIYEEEAIQFIIDKGVAKGKAGSGVKGFAASDVLTRAEAQTFLFNLKRVMPRMDNTHYMMTKVSLSGVEIGDTKQTLVNKLGQPDRIDPTEFSNVLYIYNKDYSDYKQFEIYQGQVVSMYSGGEGWTIGDMQGLMEIVSKAESVWGEPVINYLGNKYMIRGHMIEMLADNNDNRKVIGMRVTKSSSDVLEYGSSTDRTAAIISAYERQIFEFINEFRTIHGLDVLTWNDIAANAARLHSQDMAARNYFDHYNLDGKTPIDRMQASGIGEDRTWGENIAAGQNNAIEAYTAWVNSPGHRLAMLHPGYTTLGVGAAVGTPTSDYKIYYTQNFFTPE